MPPRSALLATVIEPGDASAWKATTKQADFLARALTALDPAAVSCTWCSRCWRCPSTSTSSRTGSRLDFSFSGPQGARLARLVSAGRIVGRSTPTSSSSPATSST
jgi:malonate decarboxylase alpha subunit